MESREYRLIIKNLSRAIIKKNFPGLKKNVVDNVANEIAKNIHARLYGANVNGVDSPIWRNLQRNGDDWKQPNVDAEIILTTVE